MHVRSASAILSLLLLVGLTDGAAHASSAAPGPPDSITIQLLEAAADRADDPRSRIYINDHLQPGDGLTRRIRVSNTTSRPQTLQFYAAAASVKAGSFSIAEGRGVNELTQWTTVSPSIAVVPPGGSQGLTVTVNVPGDAAGGERYAAIVADRPPPAARPGSVSTGLRVGIRMYLSVGDTSEPASDFEVTTLRARRLDDGRALVTAQVKNRGGRALDFSGDLKLTDGPGGLSGGPFAAELGTTLAPGQAAPVTVPLDRAVTGGPWTATLTLRSGLLERSARARITFPDAAGTEAAPVKAENLSPAEDPKVIVPIAVSLILLIALLLAGWLLARRRGRRRDDEGTRDSGLVPAG